MMCVFSPPNSGKIDINPKKSSILIFSCRRSIIEEEAFLKVVR